MNRLLDSYEESEKCLLAAIKFIEDNANYQTGFLHWIIEIVQAHLGISTAFSGNCYSGTQEIAKKKFRKYRFIRVDLDM